ncbi:hypothetical protein ACWATR_02625 [Nostoc sp. UIC 10890]
MTNCIYFAIIWGISANYIEGIRDWGLETGDWGAEKQRGNFSPMPNTPCPIPNAPCPMPNTARSPLNS